MATVNGHHERAILVGIDLKGRSNPRPGAPETVAVDAEESMQELVTLAESAGAEVLQTTIQARTQVENATLIGSGKVEELARTVEALNADLVIFDHELSPTQLRNLEDAVHCRVIDRTQLILDVFSRRARTREGQLQVEVAQLGYLLPRLTGRGIEMSRLGGGIGTRGPGETKLETDRRRIAVRMKKLEDELEHVRTSRGVQRQQRQAVPLSTVSLVGYTNAGKSTLFNRLTGSTVVADARMFATLDPTVRLLPLPSHRRALLSDTVGFISNLPTTLVKAFRATLEEVTEAALLLHVVDATSPEASQHVTHVLRVLEEIGAGQTPQLLVLNKIDQMPEGSEMEGMLANLELGGHWRENAPRSVGISAKTGQGVDELLRVVDEILPIDPLAVTQFLIPSGDGATLHLLHEFARVIETKYEGDRCLVVADTPASVRNRLADFII